MIRRVLRPALLIGAGLWASSLAAIEPDTIDELVRLFNPYHNEAVTSGFTDPASDIAEDVQKAAWFSGLIFLPFLIIPQILLLVVIFKFRDRGDGRKPATFMHNNKLEITWTLIPVVALIIVSIPLTALLWKTDLPAEDVNSGEDLSVHVIGKQFSWIWSYPQYGIELATDVNGMQLPMVLEEGRVANIQVTSQDVNHAWAVPSFGVKKDAFPQPRWNYTWFTPTKQGWFEGQCYELCGEGHGKMVFGVRVVDGETFDHWIRFQQDSADAATVVDALVATGDEATTEEEEALYAALVDYFAVDRSQGRVDSLRYWTAYHYFTLHELHLMKGEREAAQRVWDEDQEGDLADEQRETLRGLIAQVLAEPRPGPETDGATDDAGADESAAGDTAGEES